MSESIKDEEKAAVIDAIIVSTGETPKTPVAAQKLRRYLPSMGEALRQVLINLASETAKKILLGP